MSGCEIVVNEGDFGEVPSRLIELAVRRAVSASGIDDGQISVTFRRDADIEAMNREYLGKTGPTDVIAFSLGGEERVLGDVYIGFEQAMRQAADVGVALEEELARLAIHGTLHVLGHDHPDGPERADSVMFEVQERLLREILAEEKR